MLKRGCNDIVDVENQVDIVIQRIPKPYDVVNVIDVVMLECSCCTNLRMFRCAYMRSIVDY
jgi:hypothetical protein